MSRGGEGPIPGRGPSGRVSYVPRDIVFRNATANAPHRPQSRQQERNDWITFHFCGYTNEAQCRSQMFRSAPVDFGVILLRYSAVEDLPHANRLCRPRSSTFDDSSIELPLDPSFSPQRFSSRRHRRKNNSCQRDYGFVYLQTTDACSLFIDYRTTGMYT